MPSPNPTPAPPAAIADFQLIQQMLSELARGQSPLLQRCVADPLAKLAAIRDAVASPKVKRECDVVELGFKRIHELLDVLRQAKGAK
jgi:hypothetical protein